MMDAIATLPRTRIGVNGRQLTGEQALALHHLSVRQRFSLPAFCEIEFVESYDVDALVELFRPGATLSVEVGDEIEERLFTGEVTGIDVEHGVDNSVSLRVRAQDLLHRLQKRWPVRVHVDFSLSGLAQELVADIGLTVQDADASTIWYQRVQHGLSDLDLLRELSERCGQYFCAQGERLRFYSLDGAGAAVSTLTYGDTLLQSRVSLRTDSATRSVDAVGWDPWKTEAYSGQAGEGRAARAPEAKLAPERVGGSGHRALRGLAMQSDDQADALAQAELDRSLAEEVTFWGIAEGDPGLIPGARVRVDGLPGSLAGEFVLTAVNHSIDYRRGFTTEMTTAVPQRAVAQQRGASLAYGEVSQVDDPEGLGRIKVMLPCFEEIEIGWLELLLPAAGPDKGLIALPDVGDKVLLIMTESDPAQSIVLGGLYGSESPPDSGVEDGAVRRYNFMTPGGQRVTLDDDRNAVTLATVDGSLLELAEAGLMIHAHADMTLEAPGKTIRIRGASIAFEDAVR
jgi:phage protein D/phage baseplate assembly protein gpV